jgi:hypothetical protein
MSQQIVVASASGTYFLAGLNGGHPLVQTAKSADFDGSVIFYKDTGTVSSGQSLTAVACRVRASSNPVVDNAAGTQYVNDIAVEPDTQGLPLYAIVSGCSRGSITFTVLPEFAGTPDDTTVTLGNLDTSVIPTTFPEDLAFQFELAEGQKAE